MVLAATLCLSSAVLATTKSQLTYLESTAERVILFDPNLTCFLPDVCILSAVRRPQVLTNFLALVTVTARLSVILADLLLLIITWSRLFKQRKLGLRGGSREFTLTDVLLRDGQSDPVVNHMGLSDIQRSGTVYFLYVTFLMLEGR